jgi:2-succinyl-5-enolpyruvyl-6-hydroxy-3-cyclohexene-1-carboxylate synthase
MFHFLPISENRKFMDNFVATKHTYKMEGFAKAFNIPYSKPASLSDYQTILTIALETPSLQIIEVETNADENFLFHAEIEGYVRKRMSKGKKDKQLYATISKD